MSPYHRQGTAEGCTYTAVIGPAAGGGWRWGGHRVITGAGVTDFGPQIASGDPCKTREEAAAFADEWFYSIEDIVETTGQRQAPTITANDFPSASGIVDKKKPKKKSKKESKKKSKE
jgi:hypothetical protein